jgi:hypothetical protein
VETTHLQELRHSKIAAEALNILTQEQQEKTRTFAADVSRQREALERDIADKRQAWQKSKPCTSRPLPPTRRRYRKNGSRRKRPIGMRWNASADRRRCYAEKTTDEVAGRRRRWKKTRTGPDAKPSWPEQQLLETYKAKVLTFPQEHTAAVQQAREEAIKVAQHSAG